MGDMSNDDPTRLKHGSDSPEQLVRALKALRQDGSDASRLARVAHNLGPLLDAAPPAPSFWRRYRRPGLLAIVGGLGLGLPLLWLTRGGSEPVHEQPSFTQTPSHANELTPDAAIAIVPPTAAALQVDTAAPPAVAAQGGSERVTARAQTSRARKPARARELPIESPPPAAAPEIATPAAATPPSTTVSAPRVADNAAPTARRRTEAELLFDARRTMQSDPTGSLRTLDEHAARYPHGMLAPEREVLSIEVLRGLGRTKEANVRLSRFRAEHADSLHLPRLERERSN